MTAFDRIEPRLPQLLDELGTAGVPDYFDDMLQRAATVRQRPAWSSLERWLPMGEIAQIAPIRPRIPWRVIAIAAMLLLVAVAGLAYVGSRPTPVPVPAPFGPAANGSMLYHDAKGTIHAFDPATGVSTAIVTGPTSFTDPLPSRDGQRILYDHTEGSSQLFVADLDGSNPHALMGEYLDLSWTQWSPDSQQIGIVSNVDGLGSLTVLEAYGSSAAKLPLGREVRTFWWLPDGGIAFTGAQTPANRCNDGQEERCSLFFTDMDGTDPRMILAASEFAALSTSLSPDGRTVLYERWKDAEHGTLHIVDLTSGQDRTIRIDNLDPAGDESNTAEFSPDGSKVLMDRYQVADEHFAVVPTAGGDIVNVGPAWPPRDETVPEAHWSPDGTRIVAFYPGLTPETNQLWLLDPTGGGEDRQLDLPVLNAPAWQRLAR